jgi:hypothetical protein
MRYRIATAPAARVLPTLDGPLAVQQGEVVIERAAAIMAELERARSSK